MATRVKVGSNRKETLDLLYNITGKNKEGYFVCFFIKESRYPTKEKRYLM